MARDIRRRSENYDEFRESVAAPVSPAYQERIIERDVVYADSTAEQVVRIVAAILVGLLALRFIVALFATDVINGFSLVVFNATEWLVSPFQVLFSSPFTGAGGFFDLPAIAAAVAVMLVAWGINALIRSTRRNAV